MTTFPFSALVGQEQVKLALTLLAINPRLRGVLLTGSRGSAKSTAVRALAALLPEIDVHEDCRFGCAPSAPCGGCDGGPASARRTPFRTLPIGASEDAITGTIDVARALESGEKHFEPGLLAQVNRGWLYVDEVNLLPDHLVDLLLDVAASGVHTVERDGISLRHPSRFVLVGTMNPDEGELRPQFLDRFGLSVEVATTDDLDLRVEVARRVVAFETDPEAFCAAYRDADLALRERIARARDLVDRVGTPESSEREIGRRCIESGADGLRADIVLRKAAATHAALAGRTHVAAEDIECTAELVLRHRRRSEPSAPPPPPRPLKAPPQEDSGDSNARGPSTEPRARASQGETRAERGSEPATPPDAPEMLPPPPAPPQPPSQPRSTGPDALARERGPLANGRVARRGRGAETIEARRGPLVRTRSTRGRVRTIALWPTVRVAAQRGAPLRVREADLRIPVHKPPRAELYVFVLDASRSMHAERRIDATKQVLVGLLERAYQGRHEASLVVASGETAQLRLSATRSARRAQREIAGLSARGRTPLAHAVALAHAEIGRALRRDPSARATVFVVSDGRATVAHGGRPPAAAMRFELERLRDIGVDVRLVDAESGRVRIGGFGALARELGLTYVSLDVFETRGACRRGA